MTKNHLPRKCVKGNHNYSLVSTMSPIGKLTIAKIFLDLEKV